MPKYLKLDSGNIWGEDQGRGRESNWELHFTAGLCLMVGQEGKGLGEEAWGPSCQFEQELIRLLI